ncbi:hypothetical protein HK099_003157, partial [Clydaea vesicula]
ENELEMFYGEYCGNLCKTFWEYQKILAENSKFREYLLDIEKNNTDVSLFDLLCLPIKRLSEIGTICT